MVESTEERRGALMKALAPVASGVGDRAGRNKTTMEATLDRIKNVVEAGVM